MLDFRLRKHPFKILLVFKITVRLTKTTIYKWNFECWVEYSILQSARSQISSRRQATYIGGKVDV